MNSLGRLRIICLLAAIGFHALLLIAALAIIKPQPKTPIPLYTIDLANFSLPKPPQTPKTKQLPQQQATQPQSQDQTDLPAPVANPAPLAPASDNAQTQSSPDPTRILAGLVHDRIQDNLVYPEMARRRNIAGLVQLEIVINPDGQAHSIAVYQGSGSAILDKAALKLAASIMPVPMPEGIRGQTTILIKVNYSLSPSKAAISAAL